MRKEGKWETRSRKTQGDYHPKIKERRDKQIDKRRERRNK